MPAKRKTKTAEKLLLNLREDLEALRELSEEEFEYSVVGIRALLDRLEPGQQGNQLKAADGAHEKRHVIGK